MNTTLIPSQIPSPVLPKEKDHHYRILLSNHLTIYIPNGPNHTHWEDISTYGWHALYARARRTRVYKELPYPPYPQYKDYPPAFPKFCYILEPTGILFPIQY